ncbi:MAG: hypothetical protein WD039_07080 [Xanthobacteraceae bacterium]
MRGDLAISLIADGFFVWLAFIVNRAGKPGRPAWRRRRWGK